MRQLLKCAFLVVVFIGLAGDQVYTLGQGDPRLRPHRYFTQGKPVEGDFTHEWMDAKWYFASAANRNAFANEPERYAPQYGGYCAWAVSQNYAASSDPDAWEIVEGKLYLNYSKGVQKQWITGGVETLIAAGDRNWPAIRAGLSE